MVIPSKSNARIYALDSARGLACLTVVFCHGIADVFPGHHIFELTPLYLIAAGHEAVIFFFILSGFVLVNKCLKNKFSYKDFLIQRICRIYLPYLAAIIFTILMIVYLKGKWVGRGPNPLTWHTFLAHLCLVANFDAVSFDPVIWSLIHEMRVAIIFPVLLLLLKQPWLKVIMIAVTLSTIAGIINILNIAPSASYNSGYIYTIHYFSIFLLGGLIVKYQAKLSIWYCALSDQLRPVLLSVMMLLYCYARMVSLIPHKLKWLKLSLFNEFVADWLTAIAVIYFMIALLNTSGKKNIFQSSILISLGKISFGLYLVHVPIMISAYHLLPGFPRWVVTTISIVISIPLAFAFNKWIEIPSAKIGKMLKNKDKEHATTPVELSSTELNNSIPFNVH